MTTINSQEDFLRALEENPQWKAAVRALILGEELLQLPARFNAFVAQMTAFVDRMTSFVAEQKEFNEEQKRFNEEPKEFNSGQKGFNQAFTRRLTRIEGDISNFRGACARDAVSRYAPAITAEMGLEFVRTVPTDELVSMSRRTDGSVSSHQLRSFRTADLIIEACDGGTTQYVAVESSYTADKRDTDRAERNVEFLEEFTGETARAVVASVRNDEYANARVESGAVFWYQLEDRGPEPE